MPEEAVATRELLRTAGNKRDKVNQYVFLLLIYDREGICQKIELSEKAREEV